MDSQETGKTTHTPSERVTVRIEEKVTEPAPTKDATEKETSVVFVRDQEALSACYYRGYHDGFGDAKLTVFLLSMAVTLLALLLVKHHAAK